MPTTANAPTAEEAAEKKAAAAAGSKAKEFRVVNCGASYALPGEPKSRRFARKGEIIELDAAEETRLRALDAVVGKDEEDPTPAAGPAGDNPPGGKPLESKEEHAAKVKAAKARGSR